MAQLEELHVGFSGSSSVDMTDKQLESLKVRLMMLRMSAKVVYFHHGDAIHRDAQAHNVALRVGCLVIIHPPDNDKKRAFCVGAHDVRQEKPYLVRNDDIAREVSILFAAPETQQEIVRSGTWATVRMARRHGKTVVLLEE